MALGENEKISALSTTIIYAYAYAVYRAKSAYDNLFPSQKRLIYLANANKINKAKVDLIIDVYNKYESRTVAILIKNTPSAITSAGAYAVNAAKEAYDSLCEVRKSYLLPDDIATLNAAVSSLGAIKL